MVYVMNVMELVALVTLWMRWQMLLTSYRMNQRNAINAMAQGNALRAMELGRRNEPKPQTKL